MCGNAKYLFQIRSNNPFSKNRSIKLLTLNSTSSFSSFILNNREFFLVVMVVAWRRKKKLGLTLSLVKT